VTLGTEQAPTPDGAGNTLYVTEEGKVDARTFNGLGRNHPGCNHCHGPDDIDSAPL
jgi:hypothetical protein